MTLAALAPVPQARPVPVVQPPVAFQVPRKRINNLADIEHFQSSEAGKTLWGFIAGLSDAVVGKKLSDYCRESPLIKTLCEILEEMSSWVEQLPPKQQPARYGNPAFREWQAWLEERGPGLMLRILPEALKEGVVEIFPYFADSFGNATRIDFGTGHEANFAAWLLCLVRLGLLNEDDYQALVTRVFVKYLDLMRKLQTTYWLEPAGQYRIPSLPPRLFFADSAQPEGFSLCSSPFASWPSSLSPQLLMC
jgi:serine/threonine-protein phosphatase 2A activator